MGCQAAAFYLESRVRVRDGASYIVLLPKKLPVVRRAKPVLLLQVVHGDGQVGLSGRRGSGQKDHRLLICGERHGLVPAAGDSRIRVKQIGFGQCF